MYQYTDSSRRPNICTADCPCPCKHVSEATTLVVISATHHRRVWLKRPQDLQHVLGTVA